MNNQTTATLPAVLPALSDACESPVIGIETEHEPTRNNPEQRENSPSRRPDSDETEWHKVEHPQNSFSSQSNEEEPEWNDPERSQNAITPAARREEPAWDDPEHSQNAISLPQGEDESGWDEVEPYQNSFERQLAVDETRWHELEHFHVPHSQYLCERQQLAIRLLLIGEREGKVAQKVGIGRTTLWRWRQDIHFRDALATCRNLAYANAMERLDGLVSRAVDRIEEQIEQRDRLAPFRVLRIARADRTKAPRDVEDRADY